MSLSGSPRYLIIRRDNIGDLVCTTPFIAALRARHPDAYIAALVNSYNRAILDGNTDVDEVFAYTKAKHRDAGQTFLGVMAARIRMFVHLRRTRIDVAILAAPGFQARSLRLARLAGARQVLGFVDREGQGAIELAVPVTEIRERHEVEAVFQLGAPLGIEGEPPLARVVPDRELLARVDGSISSHFKGGGGPVIGLHISARKPSQRWPAERFALLAKMLSLEYGARILLFWSPGAGGNALHPGDDEKANEIIGTCGKEGLLAIPTTRLEDLIASMSACDMVVCSDGGAMHIAAALQKPIVCMFGDSSPSRWHPWRTPYELHQPDSRNVLDLGVEAVKKSVLKLMNLNGLGTP